MIWLVLSIIAGAALYLLLLNRQVSSTVLWTVGGLVLAFSAALAALIVFQSQQNSAEDRRADAARQLVSLRDVKVSVDPLLSSTTPPQYFKVEGWAHNATTRTLGSLRLRVRMQRCTDEAGETCETVGEETAVLRLIVPPEQSRAFAQTIVIRNPPPIERARWQVDVTGAEFR
jgi:hypothetical protein